jgi:hypothetical protein
MFRYSFIIDSLIKAMTHKYIRRIPKGVTKTGATKYIYYYAGQEGHGKGIAHDEELTAGASFAFGEHEKTRYHMHIVLEAGDKLTLKYDDGDKKGQTVTMTKKEFRDLLHKEHASSIQSAKEKAHKQLKDFQAGKEKGVKVKQSTLDKLEQRVKNIDELAPTKEENEDVGGTVKDGVNTLDNPSPVKQVEPNFQGSVDAPEFTLRLLAKTALMRINPKVHKTIFIQSNKDAGKIEIYVEKANQSGDIVLVRSIDSTDTPDLSITASTKDIQSVLGQDVVGFSPVFKYKDNALYFVSRVPQNELSPSERRTNARPIRENAFYKIPVNDWQKPEEKQGTAQQKGAESVVDRLKHYRNLIEIADSLSFKKVPGTSLHIRGVDQALLDNQKPLEDIQKDLVLNDKVNIDGVPNASINHLLESLENKDYTHPDAPKVEYGGKNPFMIVNKRWDTKEQTRWENVIKPALKELGLKRYEMMDVNKNKKVQEVTYRIPLHFLNNKPEGPEQALKDLFDDTKVPEVKYAPLTEKQQNLITKYNKSDVKGFKSFVFEDDSVGDEIENEEMGSKDPDKLYIYAEGTYADREALNKLGFKFVQKKEGEKNVSYYKYKAPISKL